MAELKFLSENEPRNAIGDWVIRLGVACVFVIFGSEKFSSNPGSHWVKLFHEIGAGDWFRYCAGAVEIAGGLLVLVPRIALAGLALLALTMAAAVVIVAFVLGRPGDSVFPGLLLVALIGVAVWYRQTQQGR
jgi:uncharacterized membrane protein YphA (DoxX/SURF4 family)